jgi:hypothetical protein
MPFWMCNAAALSDSDEADCHSSVCDVFVQRGGGRLRKSPHSAAVCLYKKIKEHNCMVSLPLCPRSCECTLILFFLLLGATDHGET